MNPESYENLVCKIGIERKLWKLVHIDAEHVDK